MGIFENGIASDLPMDKGLIFSSGKAVDAIGPNDSDFTTTDWKNAGHPLLDNITGAQTRDASGLSMYISAEANGVLTYDALFGSEEFDEWVGSVFNDGAGIFVAELKGHDHNFTMGSVADVLRQPSGGKMTINDLASQGNGGQVVGKFYDPNPVCGDMNWEYDGSSELTRTEPIQIQAGHHYYIGIMVADAVDGFYDSALAISLDGPGDGGDDSDDKLVFSRFDTSLGKELQIAQPTSPAKTLTMKQSLVDTSSKQSKSKTPTKSTTKLAEPTKAVKSKTTSLSSKNVDAAFAAGLDFGRKLF